MLEERSKRPPDHGSCLAERQTNRCQRDSPVNFWYSIQVEAALNIVVKFNFTAIFNAAYYRSRASCLAARGDRIAKEIWKVRKSYIKKGCGEETLGRDFLIKLDTEKRAISSWASVRS